MLDDTKPRIKKVDAWFFGIRCKPLWVCYSRFASGTSSESPMKAFEEWRNDQPKTTIGKIGRIIADRVFG